MDNTVLKILDELNENVKRVDSSVLDKISNLICETKRIYTYGCGRSGIEMMAFGMRIMHLGKESYYVHDTCVPPIKKDDLLIVASGSGNTESTIAIVNRANLSDLVLEIPLSGFETIQAQGNCYDQTMFICLDIIIYKCMKNLGLTEEDMDRNHTNIE